MARRLIGAGAPLDVHDPQHNAPPIGWACFGADFIRQKDGDYEGVVRALLDAGARRRPGDHQPAHAGLRAVLDLSPT